ncbi:MAG TPA: phage terminase large subunit, partial [Bacteroidia bacterium]|nr:phage terminase large subunit [Bacteroidia bacterium]
MFNLKALNCNSSKTRYIIHQGGTGSGKTFTILQYIAMLTLASEKPYVVSVVAESFPHLKRGAIRDFKRILAMNRWDGMVKENKTEHTFHIGKSIVEFFSADNAAKLRGARRDILFINECNNVDYESFQQLDVRTRLRTILDFNPVRRFWVHNDLLPHLHAQEHILLKSTYRDNEYLSRQEKQNIERRRTNLNWWKVYGEGEIGVAEGVVFSNWAVASLPSKGGFSELSGSPSSGGVGEAGTLLGYGIDFGFTHSPTAIVQVNECNGELFIHELLYRSGMQNEELFAFAHEHIDLNALAVADSAEPKTIDYLYRKGWLGLKPAGKGADSVEFGINLLLDRKINVTAESVNLIKELRQYMWDTNKDGHLVHRPVKDF